MMEKGEIWIYTSPITGCETDIEIHKHVISDPDTNRLFWYDINEPYPPEDNGNYVISTNGNQYPINQLRKK